MFGPFRVSALRSRSRLRRKGLRNPCRASVNKPFRSQLHDGVRLFGAGKPGCLRCRPANAILGRAEVAAAYYAMLDPTTPLSARLTLVGALAYFVAPFDFVPDFILAIGFLDDASILLAAITAVRSSIKEEHRIAARAALAEKTEPPGKPA